MKLMFFSLFFISFAASSQLKSYRLINNGDTINCIDKNDLKQGKWSVKVDGVRGEPGYQEEGVYKDGKKKVYGEYILLWEICLLLKDIAGVIKMVKVSTTAFPDQ
ncbi:MAG: hypothetical protein WKG06_18555 [Segetibacter sp.]